jgi:nucleoside-diphosphate-sugar epimerase
MKIVVTGAAGHIGSALIRDLPEKLIEKTLIVCIDNMQTQRYSSFFNLPKSGKYRHLFQDVRSTNLAKIINKNDVIVHLAATTDAESSFGKKDEIEKNNFEGLKKIGKICKLKKAKLIHISSTSVYGVQNQIVDELCDANSLRPQSPYAESKLKEEKWLKKCFHSSKSNFVIFRFGTIAGISPGMRFHTAVNKFCWQSAHSMPITVWRTALYQKRPYLHLDDALCVLQNCIKKNLFRNKIVNVVSENLSVYEIINIIKKYKKDIKVIRTTSPIMNHFSYHVESRYQHEYLERKPKKIHQAIFDILKLLGKF